MLKNLRLSRLIAIICSLALLVSTICIFPVSAETVSYAKTFEKYDFEDGTDFLDFGLPYNSYSKGAGVETVTEGDNTFLRIKGYTASTVSVIVNFPFELENGFTYNVSFKIKDDGSSRYSKDRTGLFVGKSTGKTESSKAQLTTNNYKGTRVAGLCDDQETSYYIIDSESFIQFNKTFTVSENAVDDTFKYLQIAYRPAVRTNGDANCIEYIDIDDICITKIATNTYVNDFEEEMGILDFAIPNNSYNKDSDSDGVTDGASVSIVEENGNSFLRLQGLNASTYPVIVNLPFELEGGATYNISYKIKDDGKSYLRSLVAGGTNAEKYLTSGSGIYIGKSTGKTEISSKAQTDTRNYTGTRLCSIGTTEVVDKDIYDEISSTEFITINKTFTVPKDAVTEDMKYFQFAYMPKRKTTSEDTWEYLDIDDICMTKYVNGSYTNDFEDNQTGMILSGELEIPSIVTDPADDTNNVISIKAGSYTDSSLILPVELRSNETYTLRFKYKSDFSGLSLSKTSIFGISNIDGDFTTELAYFKSDQALDDGTNEEYKFDWNKNKITNTDWQIRTYSFTTDETTITDAAKYFKLAITTAYTDTETPAHLYLDDISLYVNPTVTFNSNGGSTMDSINVSPYSSVNVKIPEKSGYDFAGWYFDESLTEYAGYTTITAPETESVLFAKWTIKKQAGELDGIEGINASDIVVIRKALLEIVTLGNEADCNGDGVVDVRDLVRLKKYIADPINVKLGITISDTQISGYTLVWNDEFNGDEIDQSKWQTSNENAVSLSDGVLNIRATNVEDDCYLTTYDQMNYKHGYLEVRAKLPYFGLGEWPAIWMITSKANIAKNLTSYDSDIGNMEIDIAENASWSEKYQAQLHQYLSDGTQIKNILTDSKIAIDNTSDWHTYGLYWNENELKFFLDGEIVYSYAIPEDDKVIMNQYSALLLSNVIDNEGTYFESNEYLDFAVDYVRLYQNSDCSYLINK